jgi:septal ring factor EnvC (AmiA/AmiB activator)
LENKRKYNLQKIEYTNKLIKINERNRKSSYNKLLLIDQKIKIRKDIINSISDEIDYLNNSIETYQEVIIGLESDLNTIKKEYEKIIYYSFLNHSKYDKMMFILASDNINTAFKRLKYFQQYSKYRKKQAEKIKLTKQEIGNKIVDLAKLKDDRNKLLSQEMDENSKLIAEKQKKNKELKLLSNKDKTLRARLREQNKIAKKLQKEIARIIEDEARKAAERLKNNSKDFFQLTPEEKLISDNFSKNKHRLPWPTVRGIITVEFGEQPHPFLKGIKIRNDGVDISTTEGSIVRAIYDGVVSRVFVITGAHKTVIIRHGNYLSVYSNLKDVVVHQGDKVKTKQTIGVIYTDNDKDHKTVLQFQIWKDIVKLNPADWLANASNKR